MARFVTVDSGNTIDVDKSMAEVQGYGMISQMVSKAYTGSETEFSVSLSDLRGSNVNIKEVDLYFPDATTDAWFQVFRKDTATTSTERDISHSDSIDVLFGEGYVANGSTVKILDNEVKSDKIVRIRCDLGTNSGTVYIKLLYTYSV